MTRSHDHFLDLCTGYLLDSLDPAERRDFETHLGSGCPTCEAELKSLSEAFSDMAEVAPRMTPPPNVKARVLDEIARERSASSPGSEESTRASVVEPARPKIVELRVPAWARLALPAMAVACLLLVFDGLRLRSDRDDLEGRLQIVRARITELEAERDEQAKWASLIESSDVQVAELGATGSDTPDGLSGWAVYEPSTRQAAVVLRNATPPEGSDFQLWAIDGDGPRNLGVVELSAGQGTVRVDRVGGNGDVAAIAVSLEPAGGSPNPAAPSGPVVLVGSLGE